MKLLVTKINSVLHNDPVNISNVDLTRIIQDPKITRLGLSLSLSIKKSRVYSNALIGWGTKEYRYLSGVNSKEREERFENTINEKTPAIILSKGWHKGVVLDDLVKFANSYQIPVYHIERHLTDITSKLTNYFMSHSDIVDSIHGSLVVINGLGVLLRGKSGVGKSEALLELVQRGHIFVSDDTVDISRYGGMIRGKASVLTKDFLEVRGIGLINIPYIYGVKSTMDFYKISLVIDLMESNHINSVDRLGNANLETQIGGVDLPLMQLPITTGRSIGSLIEAAVSVFLAKKDGMNPLDIIKERGDANE